MRIWVGHGLFKFIVKGGSNKFIIVNTVGMVNCKCKY